MNTDPLTFLFVQDQLSKFYAGHSKLTDGIIDEIVTVFNKRNLFSVDFMSALSKYRETMSESGKQNYTPDAWDLLRFTRRAKKDRDKKFVMGVPNWDPRAKTANEFYRRAELTLYAQFGIDNFCNMEGGWNRDEWDKFMEWAIKHDCEKEKRRQEHLEKNKVAINKAKRYFANVCNRLAGKNLIPVPPPEQFTDAGLTKKKTLYQQRCELAEGEANGRPAGPGTAPPGESEGEE